MARGRQGRLGEGPTDGQRTPREARGSSKKGMKLDGDAKASSKKGVKLDGDAKGRQWGR